MNKKYLLLLIVSLIGSILSVLLLHYTVSTCELPHSSNGYVFPVLGEVFLVSIFITGVIAFILLLNQSKKEVK